MSLTGPNLDFLTILLNSDDHNWDALINIMFDETLMNFFEMLNRNSLKIYRDYIRLIKIKNRYEYNMMRDDFQKNGIDKEYHPDIDLESSYSKFVREVTPSTPLNSPTKVKLCDSGYTSPDHDSFEDHTPQLHITPPLIPPLTRKKIKQSRFMCMFCKKNGERNMVVLSHNLKDTNGKITCPVLRNYICPLCGNSGDNAHTLSYCPLYVPRIINEQEFNKLMNDPEHS